MSWTYEMMNESANSTIKRLDRFQDNETMDKQYILDCIGTTELYTLYSDGGKRVLTSYLTNLLICDESEVSTKLKHIRSIVEKRIELVRSWNKLVSSNEYNHDETQQLLSKLEGYLFDSELLTKYLLPNLLVPLINKFGKKHQQLMMTLLVEKWSMMDRTHHITDVLDNLFRDVPPDSLNVLKCLDKKGLELYNNLPDTFRVYRGCYLKNIGGYSWSTSKKIASRFPFLIGNDTEKHPVLVSGIVSKKDVLFCVGSRNEDEIVVNPRKVSNQYVSDLKRPRDTNHHFEPLSLN